MKVSYSRVASYLRCPYSHYLGYIEGLKLKGVVRPLKFGGDFHKLLESGGKELSTIEETYNELSLKEKSELGDSYVEDLKTIYEDYKEVWKDAELPISIEKEIKFEIGKIQGEPIIFHGFIDEIYADGTIGEHKTFSIAPQTSVLVMNTQSCLYAKVLEIETGKKPEKVLWDYIKSTPASAPLWLEKSQRFSDAKTEKVTPNSYLRELKARGLTDTDNKASQYESNISNFFFRVYTDLIPNMVDTVWADFKFVVADMAKRQYKNKTRNITRDCSWCNYRAICYGEFTGADIDYIKETDYMLKEGEK